MHIHLYIYDISLFTNLTSDIKKLVREYITPHHNKKKKMIENNNKSAIPIPQSSSPIRSRRGKREKKKTAPFPSEEEELNGIVGKYILDIPNTRKVSASNLLKRLLKEEENGLANHSSNYSSSSSIDTNNGRIIKSHEDYFSNTIELSEKETNLQLLEAGGALFSFTCKRALDPFENKMVGTIANLSGFDDEVVQNYVPHLNMHDSKDVNKYTYLLARSSYLLPKIDIEQLTPELVASVEYHKCCEPENTFIWKDCNPKNTEFRITKPIIPYIYSLTVQFKVSRIADANTLRELSNLVGMNVTHGILLERTKRSVPPKQDSSRKAKSVLLFSPIEDGYLLHHLTVILQSSLPFVIEKTISTFGSWGLGEAIETARRTREYLRRTIPTIATTD